MTSRDSEIPRSAYQVYAETNAQQHETQFRLNDKAIEIFKVNLLVGSIAASIVAINPDNLAIPYFLTGSITLLASVWYCTKVYSQTKTYDIGIDEKEINNMLSRDDPESHYKDLSIAFSKMVGDFDKTYKKEANDFETGLWAATASIFILVIGTIITLISTFLEIRYPHTIDVVVMMVIGILLMYGKDEQECDSRKD